MKYFVFDVESVGLHGDGFAVGFVVVNEQYLTLDEGIFSCQPTLGVSANEKWVSENVMPTLPPPNCNAASEVRNKFWERWLHWKTLGASMWADCAWPVEGRFLARCVENDFDAREWQGPYPLHEIATALLIAGKNPNESFPRLENELPAHNPLNDARQSARILLLNLENK